MSFSPKIETLFQAEDASREQDALGLVLNVLIDGAHCTAALFDTKKQRFVYLKTIKAENSKILQLLSPEFINTNFFPVEKNIQLNIFLPGMKMVLVPEAIYDSAQKENFFKLSYQLDTENEEIKTDQLKRIGAQLLYTFDKKQFTTLKSHFPEADFYHNASPWLENLSMQYKNEQDDHIHIDFTEEGIQVAAFREGVLQICNSFLCQTAEDKLYFVMFVSEQLRLNPKKDAYYLSGNILRNSDDHQLFKKYIANLKLQERPSYYNYSLPLNSLPEHFFYKAFSTPVCVS